MMMMMMMAIYLDFEVQQVAVDLVVNIRVVLLLAQVQPWDVHRGLHTGRYHTHYSCLHSFYNISLLTS